MSRIEFSSQTAEAVPLHAPVGGLPAVAPDLPVLLPRHEPSTLTARRGCASGFA